MQTHLSLFMAGPLATARPGRAFLLLTSSEASLFALCTLTNPFPHTHGNDAGSGSSGAQDQTTQPLFTPEQAPRSSRGWRKPSARRDFTSLLTRPIHRDSPTLPPGLMHSQHCTALSPLQPSRYHPTTHRAKPPRAVYEHLLMLESSWAHRELYF